MIVWKETAQILPPIGQVVLGWWAPAYLSTVVRRSTTKWNAPGYHVAETRTPPLFWSKLPQPPIPSDSDA